MLCNILPSTPPTQLSSLFSVVEVPQLRETAVNPLCFVQLAYLHPNLYPLGALSATLSLDGVGGSPATANPHAFGETCVPCTTARAGKNHIQQ